MISARKCVGAPASIRALGSGLGFPMSLRTLLELRGCTVSVRKCVGAPASIRSLGSGLGDPLSLRDFLDLRGCSVAITTHHNNNRRTGANLHEGMLRHSNVQSGFGKLF